jgi:hypothetical protein
LREILAQLGGDDALRILIVAVDSKVDVPAVIQNVNLCFFRSGLGFERLSLPEVVDGRRGLPKSIVKRSIHSRGTFCPHRDRSSVSIRWNSRLGRHKPRE